MIKPVGNNVLIEARPKQLSGGIIVDAKENKEMMEFFITDMGKEVSGFKKGMQIYFDNPTVLAREIEGKKYAIIKDEDIIAYEN